MIFSFWFISLCITNSNTIHISTNDPTAFLFIDELYSIVYMYHSFFIHSSVNGLLGCFHALAIANSAAINPEVHTSFCVLIFSGHMYSSGITRSYCSSRFTCLRNLHTVFHSAYINLHPPTAQESSHFSTLFSSIYCLGIFF